MFPTIPKTSSVHDDVFHPLQPTTTTPPAPPSKPETTPNTPIYVGKYDYEPRTDGDLSFKKGDLMYIIHTYEDDWWYARFKNGESEGYIPSNYVAEYGSVEAEE